MAQDEFSAYGRLFPGSSDVLPTLAFAWEWA